MITVIIVCDHVMFFVYCTYGLYSVSFMIFLNEIFTFVTLLSLAKPYGCFAKFK